MTQLENVQILIECFENEQDVKIEKLIMLILSMTRVEFQRLAMLYQTATGYCLKYQLRQSNQEHLHLFELMLLSDYQACAHLIRSINAHRPDLYMYFGLFLVDPNQLQVYYKSLTGIDLIDHIHTVFHSEPLLCRLFTSKLSNSQTVHLPDDFYQQFMTQMTNPGQTISNLVLLSAAEQDEINQFKNTLTENLSQVQDISLQEFFDTYIVHSPLAQFYLQIVFKETKESKIAFLLNHFIMINDAETLKWIFGIIWECGALEMAQEAYFEETEEDMEWGGIEGILGEIFRMLSGV
ncbi:Hypothetical_protein [Hexamita inflata]|uniref:Hypothetical_protein n=1 Tax=Hexamita inflata TaxID=28002 RepID=A0AA86UNC8_9EUKA|nr:Hypothetical protein HINF_LOCUS33108 [Hexamita inflata]